MNLQAMDLARLQEPIDIAIERMHDGMGPNGVMAVVSALSNFINQFGHTFLIGTPPPSSLFPLLPLA